MDNYTRKKKMVRVQVQVDDIRILVQVRVDDIGILVLVRIQVRVFDDDENDLKKENSTPIQKKDANENHHRRHRDEKVKKMKCGGYY
jgi:hypothetical protein